MKEIKNCLQLLEKRKTFSPNRYHNGLKQFPKKDSQSYVPALFSWDIFQVHSIHSHAAYLRKNNYSLIVNLEII